MSLSLLSNIYTISENSIIPATIFWRFLFNKRPIIHVRNIDSSIGQAIDGDYIIVKSLNLVNKWVPYSIKHITNDYKPFHSIGYKHHKFQLINNKIILCHPQYKLTISLNIISFNNDKYYEDLSTELS